MTTLPQRLESTIKRYENEDADSLARETSHSILEDMLAIVPEKYKVRDDNPLIQKQKDGYNAAINDVVTALTAYCIGDNNKKVIDSNHKIS